MAMISRSVISWALLLMLGVFSGCSAFPQLVRHADPLTPEQHMQLGASYEAQGLTEAAGDQYDAAIRLDNAFIPAHIARGNLAFANGDLKTAVIFYRRALRLDRNNAGANNNMAMVCLARGKRFDKAEGYARTALKQDGPLRPYVLETLAEILIREARPSEARKALDEADSAAPAGDAPLRRQLAKTRESLDALRTAGADRKGEDRELHSDGRKER